MLQAGPPSLHYYWAVVLHSCTVLPPLGHSSNHEYHCCQLIRQSSVFQIFIALLGFSFDCTSYLRNLIIYIPYNWYVNECSSLVVSLDVFRRTVIAWFSTYIPEIFRCCRYAKMQSNKFGFIVRPCNMIDIFIITNTMHTIGVDKITLFKTT
jgi:hypothetical protein